MCVYTCVCVFCVNLSLGEARESAITAKILNVSSKESISLPFSTHPLPTAPPPPCCLTARECQNSHVCSPDLCLEGTPCQHGLPVAWLAHFCIFSGCLSKQVLRIKATQLTIGLCASPVRASRVASSFGGSHRGCRGSRRPLSNTPPCNCLITHLMRVYGGSQGGR